MMIVNNTLFRNEAFVDRLSYLNAKDDGEHYTVELVAPKRKKTDFSIEIKDDVLTIEAHKLKENESYLYHEWSGNYVKRSLKLPKDVKQEGVKAKYKSGVLTVTLPKDEAKKPRVIEVA